jgi:glycosyltransferase involved in cell wall biosynthesis
MNQQKLLISIDWFLPGTNSGGPARSIANLIDRLSHAQIYIITRNVDYESSIPYTEVPPNEWVQYSSNVKVYYAASDQLKPELFKRLLIEVSPDSVYISGIYSRLFSIGMRRIALSLGIPTIIAPRGMVSDHALGVKPFKKHVYLWWMRLTSSFRKVYFHATSPQEAKDISKRLGKNCGISVIPNIPRTFPRPNSPLMKRANELKLVCLSRISPEKGTMEAIESLKSLRGRVFLIIYGSISDKVYWKACYRNIQSLPSNVEVLYHGTLGAKSPELLSVIESAHALLLPSRGENYGHSIVEFLSQGKPVIIGKDTPWKQLEINQAGWETDNASLPKALNQLLAMDHDAYQQWTKGAFSYYEERVLKRVESQLQEYQQMFQFYVKN